MQIYLFLADGFEEIEAITSLDIFRRADIEVTTISISDSLVVTGAHNVKVFADALFSEIQFETEALLFLPGGMPGAANLDAHDGLKALLLKHSSQNGKIAAICAAPTVLGKLNLLDGKEAVCYPGFESTLNNAIISPLKIAKSENIITAKAAGVAVQLALEIVKDLKGEAISNEVKKSIFY